jgi:hypothetical protein
MYWAHYISIFPRCPDNTCIDRAECLLTSECVDGQGWLSSHVPG